MDSKWRNEAEIAKPTKKVRVPRKKEFENAMHYMHKHVWAWLVYIKVLGSFFFEHGRGKGPEGFSVFYFKEMRKYRDFNAWTAASDSTS